MKFSEGYLKVIFGGGGGGGGGGGNLWSLKKCLRGKRKTEKNWVISEGEIVWVLMVFFA